MQVLSAIVDSLEMNSQCEETKEVLENDEVLKELRECNELQKKVCEGNNEMKQILAQVKMIKDKSETLYLAKTWN